MLTPTHLVVGQAAYIAACIIAAHQPTGPEAATAMIGALIPDIDSHRSYIGRIIQPIAGWIEHHFGHRTITHSLIAQAVIGAAAWSLLPAGFGMALVVGWVSHTIADMSTPSGVCWFWPSRVRCVLPGSPRYRIEAGGRGELFYLIVFGMVGAGLMPWAVTGEGTTGLIRSAIGDIAAARKDYDSGKGVRAFSLIVRGRDNQTLDDIGGEYPVIGPFGDGGLLIESPSGPRSVCKSSSCNWYAEHAELKPGRPEQTTTRRIETGPTTANAVRDTLRPLEKTGRVYLLGELQGRGGKSRPPVVQVSGEEVRLWYATPDDLTSTPRAWASASIVVQVRHAPGVSILELTEPDKKPGLDPIITGWLDRLR